MPVLAVIPIKGKENIESHTTKKKIWALRVKEFEPKKRDLLLVAHSFFAA